MEFRILGPLEVVAGAPLRLGGAQQRALLALLVAHAGETLATARLVDELWGERPPPTAVKTVQVYVSQLRKLLGPDRLVRDGHGYRLVAEPDEIDARRFELAAAAGRRALEAGDYEAAVDLLESTDALWRGPALAELDGHWATTEAARLEDLRLVAREDRVDAELALGRHAALTGQLEALCRANPLRERLAGQRMVALYRAGRQADALEAYREARSRLVGELGIEPGPELRDVERRILTQDPTLDAPPRVLPRAQRRRRIALAIVAAAAIVGVSVAIAAGGDSLPPPGPNTAVAVSPESLEVVQRARVGDAPSAVVVAAGGAWVLNSNDETVSFVSAREGEVVRTIVTRGTPLDLVAAARSVWVLNRPLELVRIDPQAARAVARLPLRVPRRVLDAPGRLQAWATGVEDEVWVSDGSRLWRLRPGERRPLVRGVAPGPGPLDGAVSLWVGALSQVDRESLRRRAGARLAARPNDLAVGAGAVWIADELSGDVLRVDPRTLRVTVRADVGGIATGVTVGEGAVWASVDAGSLVRLDRRTGVVTGRVEVGGSPRAVAAGEGLVWVVAG